MSREWELLKECRRFIMEWRERGEPRGYGDMLSDISAILAQPVAIAYPRTETLHGVQFTYGWDTRGRGAQPVTPAAEMNPYFYSLHMLITGRMHDQPYLSALDILAAQIADETQPLHPLLVANPVLFQIDYQK